MFQTNIAENIKTYIPTPSKIVPFTRYMGKYGTAQQATDDNITWSMCFAFWITKATDTHSEYVLYQSNNGYKNGPRWCVYTYIAHLVFFFVVE
jgi:hypothetical protein